MTLTISVQINNIKLVKRQMCPNDMATSKLGRHCTIAVPSGRLFTLWVGSLKLKYIFSENKLALTDWAQCRLACYLKPGCTHWTWWQHNEACSLYSSFMGYMPLEELSAFSGHANCYWGKHFFHLNMDSKIIIWIQVSSIFYIYQSDIFKTLNQYFNTDGQKQV